jgi:hypothetical protein
MEFGCVRFAFALLCCIPLVFAILDLVLAYYSDSLFCLELIVLWSLQLAPSVCRVGWLHNSRQ